MTPDKEDIMRAGELLASWLAQTKARIPDCYVSYEMEVHQGYCVSILVTRPLKADVGVSECLDTCTESARTAIRQVEARLAAESGEP